MEPTREGQKLPSLDARDLVRMMSTHWRAVTLITLLCTLLALGWTLMQPKTYTSTASALVVATGEQDISSAREGAELAQTKAVWYESVAMSRPVAEGVVSRLSLDAAPEHVLSDVSAQVVPETSELRITAEADSPTASADLATTWVESLAEQVQLVEEAGDISPNSAGKVVIRPLSPASFPLAPTSPNTKVNLALGILVGLGLGLLYAFVRYKFDRRIRSVQEIRDSFDIPVLGLIPKGDRLAHDRGILGAGSTGTSVPQQLTEAFRKLRTNLSFVSANNPPRIVVITSPVPGDGKSSTTANLAMTIASTGRNVVVVDGDLREPGLADLFGNRPDRGLNDVLTGRAHVEEVLQTYDEFPNLRVLGAGRTSTSDPTQLLATQTMGRLLETLAEDAMVLVDAPPLLPVTDAALLTASADGAIIVITAETTTQDDLTEALENIRQVHGRVLGVVVNRVPTTGADAKYYRQYNGSYPTDVRSVSTAHSVDNSVKDKAKDWSGRLTDSTVGDGW